MITSFEVQNFRGLGNNEVSGLSRINVLVGPNGSGKTALLEAILIGSRASPENALSTWRIRTQTSIMPGGPIGFKIAWAGYFSNEDMSREILIRYEDDTLGHRELKIIGIKNGDKKLLSRQADIVTPASLNQAETDITGLEFQRMIGGETTSNYSFIGNQGQLAADNVGPMGPPAAFFPASIQLSLTDNAIWLSDLSISNREREVIDTLKHEFPQIGSIDVLTPGGVPAIYVGYKSGTNKFPLGNVSSGINKVLTLILASLHYENGVILIDEIENGIFYKRYQDMWKLLYRLALKRNNQIFISSHSLECLKSIKPLVSEKPDDFCLLRLKSNSNGSIIEKFSGSEFMAALEQDIDPRGNE